MARPKSDVPNWLQILGVVVAIILPICTWIGGSVNTGYQYANTLATKTELAEAMKAIKELIAETSAADRKSLQDYSDQNRLKTINETNTRLAELTSEQKAQAVKVDLILSAVQRLEDARKGRK